uniref:DUF4317 family protein n=1 Tax=Lachnoclostridium phocaeense TaxID=1871021 RepID=UPI0026DC551A|nr:DUF4317 family protein [Lachnoclostridium phocaeense]
MTKKEILEVKKQFTPTNQCITNLVTCFVSKDKEIRFLSRIPFPRLPEEEAFKYMDILRKALSGHLGKTAFNLHLKTADSGTPQQNELLDLRGSRLNDDDQVYAFCEKIIASYQYDDNYLLIGAAGSYDIPGKTEEDSSSVYEYILFCICPVTLSKAELTCDMEAACVKDGIRSWAVGMPENAFLYPAFNDRCADISGALFYNRKQEMDQSQFLAAIFGADQPMAEKEEKLQISMAFQYAESASYETVRAFQAQAEELLAEVSDKESVSLKEAAQMLENAGMDPLYTDKYVQFFRENTGMDEICLEHITDQKNMTVKGSDFTVKIAADRADMVEPVMLRGRMYLAVPVSSSNVFVNGIEAKISSLSGKERMSDA